MNDLAGRQFGRLRAMKPSPVRYRRNVRWVCRCDCGVEVIVTQGSLQNGHTKSCGCLRLERAEAINTIHGANREGARSPEYQAWANMKQRCENRKHPNYKQYGGRGITVCIKWSKDFSAFLADVGNRPSPQHSLDRFPNNDGDYAPGNVRWATTRQQHDNQRRPPTRFRGLDDEPMSWTDVGRILALSPETVRTLFTAAGVA